jgi:hypothetical protein
MASTLSEESCAMNRTSVPHQDSPLMRAKPVPRAVAAREAGLELIRRVNRWLIAAAVATAGLFSLLTAHAFHGHTVTRGGASSSSSAVSSAGSPAGVPQSAGGSGLQAPAQAPATAPATPTPVVSGGS